MLNLIGTFGTSTGAPDVFARATATKFRRAFSQRRFLALVQTLDFFVFFLFYLTVFGSVSYKLGPYAWQLQGGVSLFASITTHCVYQFFSLYDFTIVQNSFKSASRSLIAGVVSSSPFVLLLLTYPDDAPRQSGLPLPLILLSVFVVIAVERVVIAWLAKALQRSGLVHKKIYVIADSEAVASSLSDILNKYVENHVYGKWTIDSDHEDANIETMLDGAMKFLRTNPIDLVILKLPLSRPNQLVEAVRVMRTLPLEGFLAPSFEGGGLGLHPGTQNRISVGGLDDTVLVKIADRPISGWRWVFKDVQDRVIALLLFIAIFPLFVSIMIAIKIADRGPVFFRQRRLGYNGSSFDIIKFRTMRVVSEPHFGGVLKLATRDDQRVFPLGRLLRKTSLDELPQLLNVLMGDMWIVGPRPHSPLARVEGVIYAEAVQSYLSRYRIKPGITGWAQVCGWRGPTEKIEQLSKRLEHDLYYIDNWSSSFDLKILLKTLRCTFGHENAF